MILCVRDEESVLEVIDLCATLEGKALEIYENLENATDMCESVAHVIQGVILENAAEKTRGVMPKACSRMTSGSARDEIPRITLRATFGSRLSDQPGPCDC